MTLIKKGRGRRDETLNSQDIPANSSSSLHDKVIFQLIVYYYEPSPNNLKATPNAVDQAMDLLLSRLKNTGENQLIINLKPRISADTTFTTKKTRICSRRLFFCSNLSDLHRMISPISCAFCCRLKISLIMPNLFFHGRRVLSTGLRLQQKDQNHMAGNLFTITGHIYCDADMLLAGRKNYSFYLKLFSLSS